MIITIDLNRFDLTPLEDNLENIIFNFFKQKGFNEGKSDDMATDLIDLIMDEIVMSNIGLVGENEVKVWYTMIY